MITTKIGREAEAAVADYLAAQGHEILERNYRNRVCEIDVITKKAKIIYFIEVKYRSSEKQGDGLEYITPKKLRQLHFAARIWNQERKWEGDWRLLAASVSLTGQDYLVQELVELD